MLVVVVVVVVAAVDPGEKLLAADVALTERPAARAPAAGGPAAALVIGVVLGCLTFGSAGPAAGAGPLNPHPMTATQHGAAITVEFPLYASPAYPSGPAASGILAALLVGVKPPPAAGFLDAVAAAAGDLRLVGWVLDPQRTAAPGTVSVAVDGRLVRTVAGNVARPDVARVMRVTGPHGFSFSIWTGPGRHRICVTGHAAGTDCLPHQLSPCRIVIVPPVAFRGIIDVVAARPAAARIAGWALDPQRPSWREWVRISIERSRCR